MSTIVTRAAKGSPLTHAEVDANFTNLNTDKYQSGDSVTFTTLTANSTSEFGRSSANYVRVVGAAASNGPIISSQGSDTNIDLALTTKGTGAVRFNTGGGQAFSVGDRGTSTTDYVQALGGSGNGLLRMQGSSTDQTMILQTAGSGTIRLTTGAGQLNQLLVAHTASAVNFVQVTGAATGSNPIISVQGSDSTRGLQIRTKGAGAVTFFSSDGTYAQFGINGANNSVNYLQVAGSITGNAPVLSAQGSDTNIDLALTTKGTGAVRFNTGGGEQVRISNIASAVNFVQVTGAATGVQPIISSQGSDANIGMTIRSKGTFACEFQSSAGTVLFQALPIASSVNFCRVAPAVAGSAPVLSSQGSDTNIDLALTPKGTGLVRFGTRTATSDVAITGYLEIKDSGGTTRKLAIID